MFAAAVGFLMKGQASPTQAMLDRLKDLTERAEASNDAIEAAGLSQEFRKLSFDLAELGHKRASSYEEFAPLQLAAESAREAVAALVARTSRGLPATDMVALAARER